jgi:hypothetical protein
MNYFLKTLYKNMIKKNTLKTRRGCFIHDASSYGLIRRLGTLVRGIIDLYKSLLLIYLCEMRIEAICLKDFRYL